MGTTAFKYPPPFPRRSTITSLNPCWANVSIASSNSSAVFWAKRMTLMYPRWPSKLAAHTTLWMGMRSRRSSTCLTVSARSNPTTTVVLRGPLSNSMTRWLVRSGPDMATESTVRMRSPARTPAFSEGPPGMAATTISVSCWMMNSTPMPSKLPSMGSARAANSSALMNKLCGSSFSNTASRATCSNSSRTTGST